MKRVRSSWSLLSLVALAFAAAACSQDAGETCQLDGDCASGLVCCRGAGADRGYCGKEADDDCGRGGEHDSGAGTGDSSVPMSLPDSGEDSGSDDGSIGQNPADSGQDAASGDDAGDADGG